MIELSPRLRMIAEMAEDGHKLADVGTDHGYIAAFLAHKGLSVTASDINEAPLQRARETAMAQGVYDKLRFELANGLLFPYAEECDTVIIAGMGGETIQSILEAAPWTRQRRLILQPQTKLDELCLYLKERGQSIERAVLCEDEGRLYVVLRITAGEGLSRAEDALLAAHDKLLSRWLDRRIKNLDAAIAGMARSSTAVKSREAAEHEREKLIKIREECDRWQG